MSKICERVKNFLEIHQINNPELVYLMAFSGGFDSMCLLHSLKKNTENPIIAIHLNHKWRGEESDIEENNCKAFCEKIGVEFYSESLGENVAHTETAAREARYEFFEKCAKKFSSRIVFTAHNKNDNVETIIYRVSKGTGIFGLQGISPVRGIFYRPLLEVSRHEIEKYCKKNNLTPNVDSSNSDTKYKRNLIRSEVLPALTAVNPNVLDAVSTLIEVAKEETSIVDEYLNQVVTKIAKDGKFLTDKFLKLSVPVQNKIIYNIFCQHNLEYDRKKITNIREFIFLNKSSKSGTTCSLTSNLWLYVSEKFFEVITDCNFQETNIHITKEGKYETDEFVFEIEEFTKPVKKFPKDEENVAYVNLSRCEMNFDLRTRQDGDVIKPYGMKGSQKLKKYLNGKKIPNHEKDNLLFLALGREILWAIGLGISDKVKVSSEATHRLKFKRKKDIYGD